MLDTLTEINYFFLSLKMIKNAALAQSVEQGTENPCVLGSIPRGGILNTEAYSLL